MRHFPRSRFPAHESWPPLGPQTDNPTQQIEPVGLPYDDQQFQPDIAQFAHERRIDRANPPRRAGGEGWKTLIDPTLPRTRMANRSQTIKVANVPQLLIPQNEARSYYVIANTTGALIQISFGFPSANVGLPINNNTFFQQSGMTVSVDDIWVVATAANVLVCAFEGAPTLVPEVQDGRVRGWRRT
jgi:hypothetical protein